jgi:molecular chaperone DnaK (HSP70)
MGRSERPEIIPSRSGSRMTPSVVGLDRQDQLHVGTTAKNQLVAMPDRTVAEVKAGLRSFQHREGAIVAQGRHAQRHSSTAPAATTRAG